MLGERLRHPGRLSHARGCITFSCMKKDAALTVRLPAALKDAILGYAEASHRSAGQLITMVMGEYLEKIGEYQPETTRGRRNARSRSTGRGRSK